MTDPAATGPGKAAGGGSAILHASCVAAHGRAVLVTGPSGAGKSSLCLTLLALGARLVSDDRTLVTATPQGLVASCPSDAIRGLIEARGIGLLRADPLDQVPVALVVDLGQVETHRLPPPRHITMLGATLPLLHRPQTDAFPAALMVYLSQGVQERP